MDSGHLWFSMLWGAVGLGLFIYGKRQLRIPHLVAGLALMVCPYFISNAVVLGIAGIVLTIVPFFVP